MGDLTLVAGVVLAALGVVELVSAWSESRSPFRGIAMGVLAGGLMVTAHGLIPGGVTFEAVPMAFVNVVRSVIN